MFVCNLMSLEPISSLLSWKVNIVGRYAEFAKKKLIDSYKDAVVTSNDDDSYYQIVKNQIENSESDIILFWEEDNWFLCPEKNLFFHLLSEFENSQAELLTIGHMIGNWQRKFLLPAIKDNYLYKEYKVDSDSQKKVWEKYPDAFLTEITGIYKRNFAMQVLEFNKPYLVNAKNDYGYEIDRKKGEEFLKNRNFIDMVPTFQVFREVFWLNQEERSIDVRKALKIIKLRDAPPTIKFWRRIIRLIMEPRVLAGRIKRKIKKMTGP